MRCAHGSSEPFLKEQPYRSNKERNLLGFGALGYLIQSYKQTLDVWMGDFMGLLKSKVKKETTCSKLRKDIINQKKSKLYIWFLTFTLFVNLTSNLLNVSI